MPGSTVNTIPGSRLVLVLLESPGPGSCTESPIECPVQCMNLPLNSVELITSVTKELISSPVLVVRQFSFPTWSASLTTSYILLCFSFAFPNTSVRVMSEQYLLYLAP